ncbi:hypothetical protein DDE74_35140 [Streptomyces lydicus]|uniref:Uncharacterized protein n=1 Tax=Streptomyces lydicus TaxID=47763 RepID=A0A3S9YKB0_9ACTN|nr:hypothetical protein [Streptomyces lydicus]AZS75449.1 hypothetical protein DDE74_35140 [Streptomyces lydicus]
MHSASDRTLKLRHGIDVGVEVLLGEDGAERRARARFSEPGTVTLQLPAGETATVLRRGTVPEPDVCEVPSDDKCLRWGGGC